MGRKTLILVIAAAAISVVAAVSVSFYLIKNISSAGKDGKEPAGIERKTGKSTEPSPLSPPLSGKVSNGKTDDTKDSGKGGEESIQAQKESIRQKSNTRLIKRIKEESALKSGELNAIARSSGKGLADELKKLFSDSESYTSIAAACALLRAGDDSVKEFLVEVLENAPDSARILAAQALAETGDDQGLDELLAVIAGDDWGLRLQALRALGYFQDPGAEAALRRYSGDDDLWTRVAAEAGLAIQGRQAARDNLFGYLEVKDSAIRIYSAEVLAELSDQRTMPFFEAELDGESEYERVHGAAYLLLLGDDRGRDILDSALARHDSLGDYAESLTLRLFSN